MEPVLTIILGTGGIVGLIGGTMSIITYFSKSASSIRRSEANIKEIKSFRDTIDLLVQDSDRAKKNEKLYLQRIQSLEEKVSMLLEKNGFSESLIKKYRVIMASLHSCVYNKLNTDNCPIATKAREQEIGI